MNFNLYVFGNPQGRYTQYPRDYSEEFLLPLCENLKGARAVIHRRMDLMHYVFIERLEKDRYFGICVIFNGVRADSPHSLFGFLREVVETHAVKGGKFLRYSPQGDIVFTHNEFSEDTKAYDYLKGVINAALDHHNSFGIAPLQKKYSGDKKTLYADMTEDDVAILKASEACNTLIIEDNAGIGENHIHGVIKSLQKEIVHKQRVIDDLNVSVAKLEKTKKQYRKVVVLFAVVLCCCVGLLTLYDSLNRTERELNETGDRLNATRTELHATSDELRQARDSISDQASQISSLRGELYDTNQELGSARGTISRQNKRISELQAEIQWLRSW